MRRVLLLRELDSDGYRRFLDDYRVFVQTEGSQVVPVGSTEPHHVRDTAAQPGFEPVRRQPHATMVPGTFVAFLDGSS